MNGVNRNAGKKLDEQKQSKRDQELYNACWKEHNLSLNCLDKNNYDYDKCELYFENYKTCKRFWGAVVSHRKSNGIVPWLPLPEDREKVKAEFLSSRRR